jgi:hypothetical protein
VVVQALLTSGGAQKLVVVTAEVAGVLVSDTAAVAVLTGGGRVVRGVGAGQTTIGIQAGARRVASATVRVGQGAAVTVVRLEASVLVSMSLAGVPGSFGALVDQTAVVSVVQNQTAEFQPAFVFVNALMSDGQRQEVVLADGLQLASTNALVVTVSGQTVVAVGTGSGAVVAATLTSGAVCSNATVATGAGNVFVALPDPDAVIVTVSASKLTVVGNPAAQVGIPVSATVQVFLKFGDRKKVAAELVKKNHLFVLGKGYGEPIAYEGALKIKELCYLHAEGYSGGALKHGPFALIEGALGPEGSTPVITIILDDDHASHMRTTAEEVRARGARVYVITDNPKLAQGIDPDPIIIPNNGPLTALIAVLPLQVRIIASYILIHFSLFIHFSFFRIYVCN